MNNEDANVHTVPRHVTRVVFWMLVLVAFAACLFVLWGGLATARNAAERNDCRDILESMFARLENQDVEVNGDAIKSYLKEIATSGAAKPLPPSRR